MPYVIHGGPLDGGSLDFDVTAPGRVLIDVPARSGGPGVAVYVNDHGAYRFSGWEEEGDDVGVGIDDSAA